MTRIPLDAEILQLLAAGPRAVAALIGQHPRATVYRRVKQLCAEGVIARSPHGYSLTSVGERLVVERDAQVFMDGLRTVFTPLCEVPTPQHEALVELILAAVVLRQHTEQDD